MKKKEDFDTIGYDRNEKKKDLTVTFQISSILTFI